jgi:hypothetical protein
MSAAMIASVDPQVTVTWRSGSTGTPYNRSNFAAIASRSDLAPQVIAYWLTSASIARRAASLISSGAGKSGKPCDRLTAPCRFASRVISRMTDSVKRAAFSDARTLTVLPEFPRRPRPSARGRPGAGVKDPRARRG